MSEYSTVGHTQMGAYPEEIVKNESVASHAAEKNTCTERV